jgi:hypothetical protein
VPCASLAFPTRNPDSIQDTTGGCPESAPFTRGTWPGNARREPCPADTTVPLKEKKRASMSSLASRQKCDMAADVAAVVHSGLVAEVPSKFARAGGGRPDFGPEKSKKTHKNPS